MKIRPIDRVLSSLLIVVAVSLWVIGFGKQGERLINWALRHSVVVDE